MTNKPVDTRKRYPSHGLPVLCRLIGPFLMACVLLVSGCSSSVKFSDKSRSGPVVFLGDSLAAGYQLKPEESFVALLGERLNLEVVNLGQSGITTERSLSRIKEEVLPLEPSIVVIELGGNDALQKVDPATTKQNLQTMIDEVHAAEVPVLLLGVRGGLLNDKYEDMFEELAAENQLAFVSDILDGILTSPGLRIDNIHPNKEGHKLIADRVEPELRSLAEKIGLRK